MMSTQAVPVVPLATAEPAYMLSCGYLEHANHQGGFDAQVSNRQSTQDNARGGSDVGASLLRHSLGWETSRTHDRHRSCHCFRIARYPATTNAVTIDPHLAAQVRGLAAGGCGTACLSSETTHSQRRGK